MKLLIDSSVWIDLFSPRPTILKNQFEDHLKNHVIVTIHPIISEVLSGAKTEKHYLKLQNSFQALEQIDLDLNSDDVWNELLLLGRMAIKRNISPSGVVDRIVILSAKTNDAALWTLDKKSMSLAALYKVQLL